MALSHLLDTSLCVAILRGEALASATRLEALAGSIAVSSVSAYELWHGALRSRRPQEQQARVRTFLEEFELLTFDLAAAAESATVRVHLQRVGAMLGIPDLLIAGHAMSRSLTLVTSDDDFARVPHLNRENWLGA